MEEIFATIALATAVFASTNVDALVILGIFFARPARRVRDIVLGQLAGIGCLTAISYAGSRLALSVPLAWVPLLGVVPVCLGLRWLWRSYHVDAPVVAPRWWTVAIVAIANGADNLAVNIPVFALQTGAETLLTAAVFLVLTLVWCLFAWTAVRHPTWGRGFSRICARAAPFVLIGVGLWTLAHHPVFGLHIGSVRSAHSR